MGDLIERLRSPLPVCPFDRRSPDYWTAGKEGKPCRVCGGTEDGPDKCRGADTRCMDDAATAIEAKDAEIASLKQQLAGARAELDRLAGLESESEEATEIVGEWRSRAEAAESANKRLREATIEECAKIADRNMLGEISMLAGTGRWAVHDGACIEIAKALRALASDQTGGGGNG